jgi:hypothetical protein
MVVNIDPNVVYAILIAIATMVLIVQVSKIFQARIENPPKNFFDETEQTTQPQQWPKQ